MLRHEYEVPNYKTLNPQQTCLRYLFSLPLCNDLKTWSGEVEAIESYLNNVSPVLTSQGYVTRNLRARARSMTGEGETHLGGNARPIVVQRTESCATDAAPPSTGVDGWLERIYAGVCLKLLPVACTTCDCSRCVNVFTNLFPHPKWRIWIDVWSVGHALSAHWLVKSGAGALNAMCVTLLCPQLL